MKQQVYHTTEKVFPLQDFFCFEFDTRLTIVWKQEIIISLNFKIATQMFYKHDFKAAGNNKPQDKKFIISVGKII